MKFQKLIIESVDPYKWKFLRKSGDRVFYSFNTEKYTYEVVLSMRNDKYIEVSYRITHETAGNIDPVGGETNEGHPFRIVSTVVDILKKVWEVRDQLFDIDPIGFKFHATASEDEVGNMTKRKKLYMRFIKRHFRNADIEHPSPVKTKVKIEDEVQTATYRTFFE